MDNRRRLPPHRGVEPNLSVSAIHAQHVCERVRRDASDPVTSTPTAKEDVSGVPCKVPRFQYVDFPSLHQCIKQLSVPPLEGWLAKTPACQPSGTKERAPKFKYVDYPSLYHCIQQLSVPPLEIWSSGLTRPSPGCQSPSQALGGQGVCEKAQGVTEAVVAEQPRDAPPHLGLEKGRGGRLEPDRSRCDSGSRVELEGAAAGDEKVHRPSVISIATRRKHSSTVQTAQRESSDEEALCPSSDRKLVDPKELWSPQCSHKDKRPH